MVAHTVTATVELLVETGRVMEVLEDPRFIPVWAPSFADSIERDEIGWWARKDDQPFPIRVAVNSEAGSVDYLRPITPETEGGAFLRAIPRPLGGSVIVATLPVVGDNSPADVEKLLCAELTALAGLLHHRQVI